MNLYKKDQIALNYKLILSKLMELNIIHNMANNLHIHL